MSPVVVEAGRSDLRQTTFFGIAIALLIFYPLPVLVECLRQCRIAKEDNEAMTMLLASVPPHPRPGLSRADFRLVEEVATPDMAWHRLQHRLRLTPSRLRGALSRAIADLSVQVREQQGSGAVAVGWERRVEDCLESQERAAGASASRTNTSTNTSAMDSSDPSTPREQGLCVDCSDRLEVESRLHMWLPLVRWIAQGLARGQFQGRAGAGERCQADGDTDSRDAASGLPHVNGDSDGSGKGDSMPDDASATAAGAAAASDSAGGSAAAMGTRTADVRLEPIGTGVSSDSHDSRVAIWGDCGLQQQVSALIEELGGREAGADTLASGGGVAAGGADAEIVALEPLPIRELLAPNLSVRDWFLQHARVCARESEAAGSTKIKDEDN